MCAASEHTQQDKNNTHKKKGVCGSVECDFVWVCSCVGVCSFFKFFYFVVVTPRGSPRSRADPLSLSCPPFIHSFPLYFFLYTHSSSAPSLLAQRWMAPSLWWVTDEWSSSLKSRVTARLVKREETPDKRRRRGRGGREGEKGRKGGGRGGREEGDGKLCFLALTVALDNISNYSFWGPYEDHK